MRNVLMLAAEKVGWNTNPPKGIYRGIASCSFQDTNLTYIAEVSLDQFKTIKVRRVVCAVDCGIAVNPKSIEAQIEGCIAFGLTATLKDPITIKDGKIQQSNFDDFQILRFDEMPKVEVHIVPSTGLPTSIGEAGVPVIAPAVANAVFVATGKRVRKLPVLPEDLIEN
jgi:isoquinoline 1-oxidoreductase beta subunit